MQEQITLKDGERKYLMNIQFGIFFANMQNKPDIFGYEIVEKYSNIFQGSPLILPIPEQVVDIPVFQISSEGNKWQLNISRSRMDIAYTPDPNQTHTTIKDKILEAQEIIKYIAFEKLGGGINRITNISNIIYEVESPDDTMCEFLSLPEEQKKDYQEISIRFNNPKEENGIPFNCLYHYQVGNKIQDQKKVILLQIDFNSNNKKKNTFNQEDINNFWSLAEEKSYILSS